MASFVTLPIELQLAIVGHLPPRTSSIRPYSNLLPLSQTSHHFYDLLTPLVHRELDLSDPLQGRRLLIDAPRCAVDAVKSLALRRRDRGRRWPLETWLALLDTVGRRGGLLTELSLASAVLEHETMLSQLFLDACSRSSLREQLRSLELDLLPSSSTSSTRADYPELSEYARDDPDRAIASTSASASASAPALAAAPPAASQLDLVEACFGFDCLERFVLSNATLSLTATLPWALPASARPQSRQSLRHVEFCDCVLSDAILVNLIAQSQGTLQTLVLKNCVGFSSIGLRQTLEMVQGTVTRLEITMNTGIIRPRRQPSSGFRSSPPSPTTPHRSIPPPCMFAVDSVLPRLKSLRRLVLTGPLITPTAVRSIPTCCPAIRHLSISSNPHISPCDFLPVLASSTLRLGSLSYEPSDEDGGSRAQAPSPTCSPTLAPAHSRPVASSLNAIDQAAAVTELTSIAISRNVVLKGSLFEQMEERIRWAIDTGLKHGPSASGGSSRRKRPGICL
ncbi:uncharacterized protein JCM15063_002595 [Sporobolomyces koalae]|uniref:uncharacterized protein n=1 Tax=Sporobolomyces koalae TaxID=500713 RepID=UPI00318061EE